MPADIIDIIAFMPADLAQTPETQGKAVGLLLEAYDYRPDLTPEVIIGGFRPSHVALPHTKCNPSDTPIPILTWQDSLQNVCSGVTDWAWVAYKLGVVERMAATVGLDPRAGYRPMPRKSINNWLAQMYEYVPAEPIEGEQP